MARPLVTDEPWAIVEPLIPVKPRRRRRPGRRPIDNRRSLEGILFVPITGIPWERLPAPFGCSGMTCWRRLRDWNAAGVWERIHLELLHRLRAADALDWSHAVVDSGSLRAVGGAN